MRKHEILLSTNYNNIVEHAIQRNRNDCLPLTNILLLLIDIQYSV